MKLGFISDLHLSENMPSVTEGFFNFLNNAAQELSHLYILGDLFEAWIGDDDNSELAPMLCKILIIQPAMAWRYFLFMATEISCVAKTSQKNLISSYFQIHFL